MPEELVTCPDCGTRNFTPRGLKAHRCDGHHHNAKPDPSDPSDPADPYAVEIIPPGEAVAIDLSAAARAINEAIDTVTGYEESFEDGTLAPRLILGLEITKAKEVFGMTNAQAAVLGGEAKAAVSRRDTVIDPASATLGFEAWLKREIPRLKRPTALKYATAFKSLDLDPGTATPALIRECVKKLRHEAGKASQPMPTLGSLYRAGKPTGPLQIEFPVERPTLKLEDAREHWHLWREAATTAVSRGILDDLDAAGLDEMKTFSLWLRDRINARLKTL